MPRILILIVVLLGLCAMAFPQQAMYTLTVIPAPEGVDPNKMVPFHLTETGQVVGYVRMTDTGNYERSGFYFDGAATVLVPRPSFGYGQVMGWAVSDATPEGFLVGVCSTPGSKGYSVENATGRGVTWQTPSSAATLTSDSGQFAYFRPLRVTSDYYLALHTNGPAAVSRSDPYSGYFLGPVGDRLAGIWDSTLGGHAVAALKLWNGASVVPLTKPPNTGSCQANGMGENDIMAGYCIFSDGVMSGVVWPTPASPTVVGTFNSAGKRVCNDEIKDINSKGQAVGLLGFYWGMSNNVEVYMLGPAMHDTATNQRYNLNDVTEGLGAMTLWSPIQINSRGQILVTYQGTAGGQTVSRPAILTPKPPPGSQVTIAASADAREFMVTGADGCQPGTYQTPHTLTWATGESCTVTFPVTQSVSPGVRYVFTAWQDGYASNSRTFTAAGDATYTALFDNQNYLTMTASPAQGGSCNGSGWYNTGSIADISAVAAERYRFTGFSGGFTASQSSARIYMPTPLEVFCNFVATPYLLTTSVQPASAGTITPGRYISAGELVDISASAAPGYVFSHYSGYLDTPVNPIHITISSDANIVANFARQVPLIAASITAKAGLPAARAWTITLRNSGAGVADSASIDGLALAQSAGAACTPVVGPAFPVPVGTLNAGGGSASGAVQIDFSGCAAGARFTVTIPFRANGATYSGSSTIANQFR